MEYDGEWDDFLSREEGKVWREDIASFGEKCYHSVPAILTDNLDSILFFNMGQASILEGRKFLKEEYTEGKEVCLISSAYAEKNGITVGDRIDMDFYQGKLRYSNKSPDSFSGLFTPVIIQDLLSLKNRINIQKKYDMVSIYEHVSNRFWNFSSSRIDSRSITLRYSGKLCIQESNSRSSKLDL